MASVSSSVIGGMGSGAINVSEIVTSIMETRRAPVRRIEAEIEKRNVSISALGIFRSKVEGLQQAVGKLERSSSYVSSGDESARSATVRSAIEVFVSAYNGLVSHYRSEALRVTGAETQGSLVGNFAVSRFMTELRSLYSSGIKFTESSSSFSLIGIDLEIDGSLSVNENKLSQALDDGLADKFALGAKFGYQTDSRNLGVFLKNSVFVGGYFSTEIELQGNSILSLRSRKADVEASLELIKDRLMRQYAKLDAQLLQLQNTNSSMGSMFSSLISKSSK